MGPVKTITVIEQSSRRLIRKSLRLWMDCGIPCRSLPESSASAHTTFPPDIRGSQDFPRRRAHNARQGPGNRFLFRYRSSSRWSLCRAVTLRGRRVRQDASLRSLYQTSALLVSAGCSPPRNLRIFIIHTGTKCITTNIIRRHRAIGVIRHNTHPILVPLILGKTG